MQKKTFQEKVTEASNFLGGRPPRFLKVRGPDPSDPRRRRPCVTELLAYRYGRSACTNNMQTHNYTIQHCKYDEPEAANIMFIYWYRAFHYFTPIDWPFLLGMIIPTGMFTKNWHICFTIFTEPNVARMNLWIPHDSAIDGILFNRRLNYAIPTSQSQQGIFEMVYFSGERATDEVHLQMNRRTSTHNCRYRTAAVPAHRRSLCTIT